MRNKIAKFFPGKQVTLTEKVESGSGKFELFVEGKQYHSMKGGEGHLSNYDDKIQRVVDALKKDGY